MYEEAKAACASQIDRFYLSYCGASGNGNSAGGTHGSPYAVGVGAAFPVAEQDHDSDQVGFILWQMKDLLYMHGYIHCNKEESVSIKHLNVFESFSGLFISK